MTAWAGSNRRTTLPPEWPRTRARILDRDHHRCTWRTDHGPCGAHATDVDHVGDPTDHSDANLRSLCSYHHNRRSGRQGNRARPKPPTLRRPTEAHPGVIP